MHPRLLHHLGFVVLACFATSSLASQSAITVRKTAPAVHSTTEPLGLLLNVIRLTNGSVVVNDGGNKRLLWFDSTLSHARVIANAEGTAGFKYGATASPIIRYRGDSTLFLDRASRTFIVLDADGKQARTASLPKLNDWIWVGGGQSFVDPAERLVYRGAPRGIVTKDTGQAVMINRLPDSAAVVRGDFERRTVDTAGFVKLPTLQENHRRRFADGSAKTTVILFGLSWIDDWTMTSDGTIAIVRGQDYHIDWIAMDGTRSSTPKMPHDWRAISEAEQQRLADSAAKETQAFIDAKRAEPLPPPRPDGSPGIRIAARADLATGAIQLMPIDAIAQAAPLDRVPDFHSPVRTGSTLADTQGRVWILPTNSAQANTGGLVYDVVNRKGEITERVQLPPGRSIVAFGPRDILFLMSKDASANWRIEITNVVRY